MTMTAARNTSAPNSFSPDRTTAMTISATTSADATPTTHKGTVKVPLARSRPGSHSRFITHTLAAPTRRQYDAGAQFPPLETPLRLGLIAPQHGIYCLLWLIF